MCVLKCRACYISSLLLRLANYGSLKKLNELNEYLDRSSAFDLILNLLLILISNKSSELQFFVASYSASIIRRTKVGKILQRKKAEDVHPIKISKFKSRIFYREQSTNGISYTLRVIRIEKFATSRLVIYCSSSQDL